MWKCEEIQFYKVTKLLERSINDCQEIHRIDWFRLYSVIVNSIATWLILPVVVRSSQRLSHACLSMNIIQWNCEWLIISVIVYLIVPCYLDNRSNSRANTCTKTRLLEGLYLLDTEPTHSGGFWWFIITSRIALLYAGDDSFKFLPYQLSMVG